MPGGLVTADQNQQRLVEDLVIGQPLTVDLCVDQDGEQIVGRLGAAFDDGLHGERGVSGEGFHHCLQGGLVGGRTQTADQVVGPLQQCCPILRQNPEHVADDGHRQRRGEVVDEVALAAFAHRIDECVAQGVDTRGLIGHPLAGEPGVHQLAPQQMRGIVHVDHVGHGGVIRSDTAGRGEQLGIAFGVEHRLIARRGGKTVAIPEHRFVRSHPAVRRPGTAVGEEIAVGQIDVRLGIGVSRCHR